VGLGPSDPKTDGGARTHRHVRNPVTLATPADGANYAVIGPAVIVDYACTDEPGGSGIASCTATQPDGSTLPTGLGAIGMHA
jgi:hypothetical protein